MNSRGIDMYQCQTMFGEKRGSQMCAMIEDATSQACPCKAGRPCPLVSGDLPVLVLPAPV